MSVTLSEAGVTLIIMEGQIDAAMQEHARWSKREREAIATEREARANRIAAHHRINQLQSVVQRIKESL